MNLGEISDDFFFNDADHNPADDRTPNRAETADDGHEENLHAGLKGEDAVGMNVGGVARKQTTGDAGEGGGESVGRRIVSGAVAGRQDEDSWNGRTHSGKMVARHPSAVREEASGDGMGGEAAPLLLR